VTETTSAAATAPPLRIVPMPMPASVAHPATIGIM
jgi:hypothetical protein